MRIRWLTYHPGFGGPWYRGDVAEVADAIAANLIAAGNAEPADKPAANPGGAHEADEGRLAPQAD